MLKKPTQIIYYCIDDFITYPFNESGRVVPRFFYSSYETLFKAMGMPLAQYIDSTYKVDEEKDYWLRLVYKGMLLLTYYSSLKNQVFIRLILFDSETDVFRYNIKMGDNIKKILAIFGQPSRKYVFEESYNICYESGGATELQFLFDLKDNLIGIAIWCWP